MCLIFCLLCVIRIQYLVYMLHIPYIHIRSRTTTTTTTTPSTTTTTTAATIYIYIHIQKRRLWGLHFGNPLFSVVLYVSKGCAWVSVSVGRSFGAHACMVLFPTTKSALDCFKTRRSVYKHRVCLQTLRFGIPCFQRFRFVGLARCLLCLLYDT